MFPWIPISSAAVIVAIHSANSQNRENQRIEPVTRSDKIFAIGCVIFAFTVVIGAALFTHYIG